MLFKNLTVFRFDPQAYNPQIDAAVLGSKAFRPCGEMELSSAGWVPPLGRRATDLLHSANGKSLLCLQTEEKILPAAVIRQEVDERAEEIEGRDMRKLSRREKAALKEDVVSELLPQAFSKLRQTHGYLDFQGGYLLINSASRKEVENFTACLRATLGSLPISPLKTVRSAGAIMTHWLQDASAVPQDIELQGECELHDEGTVRIKDLDLYSEEVNGHLQAGMQVKKLALRWSDRVALVLADDLVIRRIKFLDVVQEQLAEMEIDSLEQLFDAEFVLMGGEFGELLARFLAVFGEADTDQAPAEEVAADEAEEA